MKKILITIILGILLIGLVSALDYSTVNSVFSNFEQCYNSEGVYQNSSNIIIGNINGSIRNVILFNGIINSSHALQLNTGQYPLFYPTSQTNQTLHPISISSGYNKLNVSINQSNQENTNLSIRLGTINKSLDNLTGLVYYLPAEWNSPTAWDIQGNNDGTVTGGVLWNTTGGVNQSGGYQFDGVNDYVGITNTPSINFSDLTPFTYSVWVNFPNCPSNSSNNAGLIGKRQRHAMNFDYYSGSDCQIVFGMRNVTTYKIITTTGNLTANTWHHILGTYNSTKGMEIWIDGIENVSGLSNITNVDCVIGHCNIQYIASKEAFWGGDPKYFNGSIDEVMIFSRALSATEISQIYERQSTKYNQVVYTDEKNITSSSIFDISTDASYIFSQLNYQTNSYNARTPVLVSPIILTTNGDAPNFINYIENPINNSQYVFGQSYTFNSTIIDENGLNLTGLEFNGVNYSTTNLGSNLYGVNGISGLTVGTYAYYWYARDVYGNYNTSGMKYYTIRKGTPPLTLTSSLGWIIMAVSNTTITGSDCPLQLTCYLHEIYNLVSNPFNDIFPAGSYYFNFNTTGNINYTNYNVYNTLISQVNGTSGIVNNTILKLCRYKKFGYYNDKLNYYKEVNCV